MSVLRLGIVGSGMIASVVTRSAQQLANIKVVAVTSRRVDNANTFANEHGIDLVFDDWKTMLLSSEIDAVYIATPTTVKEEIAVYAAENKKHVLVDKPFINLKSVQNIVSAAEKNGVAFMDGTHFTNNPRTQQIKANMGKSIGLPQAVRSSFFFPFMDKTNIRFNPEREPTGAVGDMTWYSMRAIVEYLQPTQEIQTVSGHIVRDEETGTVVRGSGMIAFTDGKSSTFDFGYNAGVCLMDLDILGSDGMFSLNDFVLDWKNGFAFNNPNHITGYMKRKGMADPSQFEYIETDFHEPQSVAMIKNFIEITKQPQSKNAKEHIQLTMKTQELVDIYWKTVNK
ncbi:Gfo/Idh/MocA family protein [Vibrio parahaemolyticus]